MTFIITSLEGKPSNKRVKLDQIEFNNHRLCDFFASYCQLKNTSKPKIFFKTKGLLFVVFFPRTPLKKPAAAWWFQPDHQQFIWVIFSNKHEAPNNRLKKKRWKLPHIPQNTSLQVVRINVKQITVEWNFNFEFGWISIRPWKNATKKMVLCHAWFVLAKRKTSKMEMAPPSFDFH